VSWTARRPKRNDGDPVEPCLRCTNVRAADFAFASAAPLIDRELSIGNDETFASPRLTASKPLTGAPFSIRRGVFETCAWARR